MDELKEIVSKRLTELLILKDFSQADLSRESGVSKDTISKAINKKGTLSVNMAKRISKALGISLDYLYGNSDVESIPQHVLDIMEKHISSYNRKSVWGSDSLIMSISLSQPLATYLEAICEAEKVKMPDYVRGNWLQDEKERFLQAIENDTKEKIEYALIKHIFLTDKVLEQLSIAKDEIHITKNNA